MPSCAPKQCLLVGAQHCWLFLYHRLLYPARHLCPSQGQSPPLHLLHPSHLTPVPAASALIVGLSEVSQGSTLSAAGPHTGPSRQTTVILRDLFFIRVCRLALGERECGESEMAVALLTRVISSQHACPRPQKVLLGFCWKLHQLHHSENPRLHQ